MFGIGKKKPESIDMSKIIAEEKIAVPTPPSTQIEETTATKTTEEKTEGKFMVHLLVEADNKELIKQMTDGVYEIVTNHGDKCLKEFRIERCKE